MPLREIINIQAASAASKPAVFTANQPNNGPPDGGSNQSVPSRQNSGKCFFFKFLNVSLGRVCGDFCGEHLDEVHGGLCEQVEPQREPIFGRDLADLRPSLWRFLWGASC